MTRSRARTFVRRLAMVSAAFVLTTCGQTARPINTPVSSSTGATSSAAPRGSPGTQPANQESVTNGKIIHLSQPLTPAKSPGGEFSIAVPTGWTINPSKDGQTFDISAPGQAEPKIYVAAAIPVSDLRADEQIIWCAQHAVLDVVTYCTEPELLDHLQDAAHQWSASDAVPALLGFQSAISGNRFGSPQVTTISQTSARYAVSVQTPSGANWVDSGLIQMGYMNTPAFDGTTSLSLVTGCESSRDQYQALQTTCERALSSFHASPAWLQNLATRQMQAYSRELQRDAEQIGQNAQLLNTIRKFGSSMQQMQAEEFKSMEEATARVGGNWSTALGGQANKTDPGTGNVYQVDSGYASYCVSNLGNIMESQSSLGVGQYFGTDTAESCDRLMQ